MNIPEEAIEKAARKIFEYDAPYHRPDEWEPLNKYAKFDYRNAARAVLEAAVPPLMAQAWEEGQQAGYENAYYQQTPPVEPNTNPYRKEQP
jgi:hypothetical protein